MSKLLEKGYNKNGHQIYYHYDNVKVFTPEEIEKKNEAEKELNEKCLQKALKDGYIELPIFSKDVNGKTRELKAWIPPTFTPSWTDGFLQKNGMDYNIYIPSYKRADDCATAELMKEFHMTNWYLMVDPSQYEDYKKYYPMDRIILRDIRFRDPNMVDLTTSIKRPNSMSGTAGIYNNLLSFSRSIGEDKYFTMDDDFIGLAMKAYRGPGNMPTGEAYDKENFYRCSNIKEKYGFSFKKFMHSIETVSQKLRNHGFVGLEKFGIVFTLCPQWKTGTRVYSFYLSDNKTQHNHVGAMNNDVITSLEQSKYGCPPCLLEVISYNSKATQAGGGLTDQYKLLGTLEKGKILVKNEPNYARISINYNRIHHFVNYNSYNGQRLVGTIKNRK